MIVGAAPPAPVGDPWLTTALGAAMAAAPGVRSARWLAACAGVDAAVPSRPDGDAHEVLDAIADGVWRGRSRADRRRLGQVFTPRAVARQVLLELGGADDAPVLDPACGAGVFLAEAAGLRAARGRARGWSPERIARDLVDNVLGVELDPSAARLARLVLGHRVVDELGPAAEAIVPELALPAVRCGDATDPDTLGGWPTPGWVVGNPPYREAKGMDAAARDRLRARFGDRLGGAFDVYLAFVWLALELVPPEGRVGLVLPNKLLVARYAGRLRRAMVEGRRLHTLIDLSELDVFGRVGVYPVIVALGPPRPTFRASFAVPSVAGLGAARLAGVELDTALLGRLASPPVWVTLPEGPLVRLVGRLADGPRLRDVAQARSTCSFHARGLRERFVGPEAELPDGVPYLGGRSYTRRAEVRPFAVDWQGYRIRFDADELRRIGNPLPPLERFQRPKAVICQHARRAVAYFDEAGRFVTKDVYPIVLPHQPDADAAAALVAVLNSRTFSVVYHLLYRGIAISGGYLHFLPAFLHEVPVPRLDRTAIVELAGQVRALQAQPDRDGFEALDARIAELYDLDPDERSAVRQFADRRLGFSDPFG